MATTLVDTQTWIDEYTEWACKCSPLTPPHFHQNIALTIACANIARRVHLQLKHEKLYPNIYTLIVAITTVHAKTTAFNLARKVIQSSMSDKVISSISTPEAFTDQLAGVEPANFHKLSSETQERWQAGAEWGARRLFMLDEAGRFFNSMKRDYNTTLDSMLMQLYDSLDEPILRETRKDGITEILNPSLSCLFATTPSNIKSLLGSSDSWSDGFWARWNFVTIDQPMVWKVTDDDIDMPSSITNKLQQVSDQLSGRDCSCAISKAVLERYYDYAKEMREIIIREPDEKLHGIYGRMATKRMKTAICFAVMDNPKRPEIKVAHWNMTEGFILGWQRDAILAIAASKKSDKMDLETRAWGLIVEYSTKGGITARRIQQLCDRTAAEISPVISGWLKTNSIKGQKSGKTWVFYPFDV